MYRTTMDGSIQRLEDGAFIPKDEMNGDYQEYLQWAAIEGNEIEPYVPPIEEVVVPQTVTMRQARLALLGAGLLDDVETAINNMESPQKEAARISWDFSSEVHRTNGITAQLGPLLGLDEEALDSLFTAASKL